MEEILKEIEKIRKNNFLIIAEGKKDISALKILGLKNVISLKNKPLFEVIEEIRSKDIVILTDLDTEGRKIFSKLRCGLQKNGIRVHNKLRNLLFKTKLRNIEGLDSYLNK